MQSEKRNWDLGTNPSPSYNLQTIRSQLQGIDPGFWMALRMLLPLRTTPTHMTPSSGQTNFYDALSLRPRNLYPPLWLNKDKNPSTCKDCNMAKDLVTS